jgi:hypothetical protein
VCGKPTAEVAAALGFLGWAFKGTEALDLTADLADLRQMIEAQQRRSGPTPDPRPNGRVHRR